MTPESCPNCGADVPRNARVCPGCGADEKTGWSDSAYASGLGLPDEEFDHAEFVKAEFGGENGGFGRDDLRGADHLIEVEDHGLAQQVGP